MGPDTFIRSELMGPDTFIRSIAIGAFCVTFAIGRVLTYRLLKFM
jgi:hypothetical protein